MTKVKTNILRPHKKWWKVVVLINHLLLTQSKEELGTRYVNARSFAVIGVTYAGLKLSSPPQDGSVIVYVASCSRVTEETLNVGCFHHVIHFEQTF